MSYSLSYLQGCSPPLPLPWGAPLPLSPRTLPLSPPVVGPPLPAQALGTGPGADLDRGPELELGREAPLSANRPGS
ncbi:hypothetical protein DPMN_140113 [Dreissena polymorpha]|uniref:Uncharacterized protein n=1 Tax=Dreissena polymorpha TaxID=45954 RepID=A0A9D4JK28_DREPO|nr:hypothetical protein DPMN_140113 [Dreissena polymorpha]